MSYTGLNYSEVFPDKSNNDSVERVFSSVQSTTVRTGKVITRVQPKRNINNKKESVFKRYLPTICLHSKSRRSARSIFEQQLRNSSVETPPKSNKINVTYSPITTHNCRPDRMVHKLFSG